MGETVNLMLNVVLLAGLGGLWLLWWQTQRRQQKIEGLLAATAAQLEEASRHLEGALAQIERLRQQPATAPAARAAAPVTGDAGKAMQILRMQREGKSPELIAHQLAIPLAQVELMLKLQAKSPA